MPELMTMFSTALTSAKAMRGIISAIIQANVSYEKAGLQLEFVKLADLLRETEDQLKNMEWIAIDKDKRIAELENILKDKNNLIRYRDAYYEKDVEGNAFGDPFCICCWDAHCKKINLIRSKNSANIQICPSCKNEQRIDRAPPNKENKSSEALEKPIAIGNCYKFSNDEKKYCSSCYDNSGKKTLATKLSAQFYQCPICKVTLSLKE